MKNSNVTPNFQISVPNKSNEIKIKLSNDSTLIDSEISDAIQKAQTIKDKNLELSNIQKRIDTILNLVKINFTNISDAEKAEKLEFINKNIDYKFLPTDYKKGFAMKNGAVIKFEFSENKIRFQKSDLEVKAERFHVREFCKYSFADILKKFELTLISEKEKIDKFKLDEKTAQLDKATKLAESNNEIGLFVGREITRDLAKSYSRAIQIKINPQKVETTKLSDKTIATMPKNAIVSKRKTPKVAPPKGQKAA